MQVIDEIEREKKRREEEGKEREEDRKLKRAKDVKEKAIVFKVVRGDDKMKK